MWLSCGPPKRKWKKSSFRFLFWPMKFLTDLSFLCCFPSLLFFFLSLQSEGQTALHIAAYEGDETMIKFLQAARADANIADSVSSCYVDVSIDNRVTTHQLSHKRKGFSNLVALAKLQLNTGSETKTEKKGRQKTNLMSVRKLTAYAQLGKHIKDTNSSAEWWKHPFFPSIWLADKRWSLMDICTRSSWENTLLVSLHVTVGASQDTYWQLFPFSWSVSTTAHHFTWRLNEVTQWSPSS